MGRPARARTNQERNALRQRADRKCYRAAGVVMDEVKKGDPFKRWGHWAVGISTQAGPVKVYGPDGTLREVVPAAEWRRRFGDPFKNQSKEAEDASEI